jgi:hypothetical protein
MVPICTAPHNRDLVAANTAVGAFLALVTGSNSMREATHARITSVAPLVAKICHCKDDNLLCSENNTQKTELYTDMPVLLPRSCNFVTSCINGSYGAVQSFGT